MGRYQNAYSLGQFKSFDPGGYASAGRMDQYLGLESQYGTGEAVRQMQGMYQPSAPQQSLMDRVLTAHQKAKDDANKANQDRAGLVDEKYRTLLGQNGVGQNSQSVGYVAPGMPALDAGFGGGGNVASFAGGGGGTTGITLNQWGAGNLMSNSPLYGPSAAAHLSDVGRRGLSDTTVGTNGVVLGNSMDLARARQQELQTQLEIQNQQFSQADANRKFGYGVHSDNRNRTDRLTQDWARSIEGRNDVAPDDTELLNIIREAGRGNQDNMVAGGGGGMSYGNPGGAGIYNVPGQSYGNMGMQQMGPYSVPNQSFGWGAQGSYYRPQGGGGPSIDPMVAVNMRAKQSWYDHARAGGVRRPTNVQNA